MKPFAPNKFRNREEAANALAERLDKILGHDEIPLILGIPRGGVPMAKVISEKLNADLDVVLVRKVGHPMHPEFAVASVTEKGEIHLGEGAKSSGISLSDIEAKALMEISTLSKKRKLFTPDRKPISPLGRSVVIVDDGIATGATMVAALQTLKSTGAKRLIVATPVASKNAVELLQAEGAEVCALIVPDVFYSVSQFYDVFEQVSDKEVVDALKPIPTPTPFLSEITIHTAEVELKAFLQNPKNAKGLVIFAHGSGSSRHSIRNQFVAQHLHENGFATLLVDLLTEEESKARSNVFDIGLLAERLGLLTDWAGTQAGLRALKAGYFGASTGGGAALEAAAENQKQVYAVVSRGGRPDLAKDFLAEVKAPTLLIVGGDDGVVISMNEWAYEHLKCERSLEIIPGAGHLFEESGALEAVAKLATDWFSKHLLVTSRFADLQ